MADTFTANLSLTKPEPGGSTDTWGNKTNTNWDTLDAKFPSGDLGIADGGTGASTAAAARTNLGIGTLATQNASAVAITGGSATLGSATISSLDPGLLLTETDAPTSNKNWALIAVGQTLRISCYDDAFSGSGQAITITRSGTSPSVVNVGTTLQVSGNVAYHAGNLSAATIAESQITDSALLSRNAANETITGTWSFTATPSKTGGGKFLHYASSTYSGGTITVSTVDASGTPSDGDRWVKYI